MPMQHRLGMRCWLAVALQALLGLLPGAGARAQQPTIPLPQLPAGVIELRVVYVSNPRLPEFSDSEIALLLETARQGVREHFGIDVRFDVPERLAIGEMFERYTANVQRGLNRQIYDFKHGGGNEQRLNRAYAATLARYPDLFEGQLAYARPYLLSPPATASYEGLAAALTATHLARLAQFRGQHLPDGASLVDNAPYNEYVYWDALDRIHLPYEVVLTNQLLVSAEYNDVEVHSAIRGGVSAGITSKNGMARFLTTSIASTYGFIGEDDTTRELRGGESYTWADAARYAGYLLVHELGHQLLHLGHPFGRRACVMNPAELLHFREWVGQMAADQCPLAAEGPMQPGFVKIPMPASLK